MTNQLHVSFIVSETSSRSCHAGSRVMFYDWAHRYYEKRFSSHESKYGWEMSSSSSPPPPSDDDNDDHEHYHQHRQHHHIHHLFIV